jgi:hypothetical protein
MPTYCKFDGCNTRAVFGKQGSKIAEYCKSHSPADYIDIKSKRCIHPNCNTMANFGKQGSKIAEYCKSHSPADYIDIKSKRCIHPNCNTMASYNYPGFSKEYCKTHSLKRMIYNPLSKSKEEDIQCSYCNISIHYNELYCASCKKYIQLGNKTVKRKEKELEIKSLLEENEIKFNHDIIVKDGCSKKRPDFIISTIWGTIILEIDEFQHIRKSYSCECEINRMKQIYQDIGEQNCLFIRYNPDSYKTLNENKSIPKNERKNMLIKFINDMINTNYTGLGVIYLFYDGFIIDNLEIEKINYV